MKAEVRRMKVEGLNFLHVLAHKSRTSLSTSSFQLLTSNLFYYEGRSEKDEGGRPEFPSRSRTQIADQPFHFFLPTSYF